MGLTRRSLLRLGALAAASIASVGCRKRWQTTHAVAANRAKSGPRYCVVLFLRGGIDAVFTTDPRRPSEVDPGIDVPYPESSIVTAGDLRVGPHLAPLAASLPRLAILNGVRVHTANHETGAAQVLRLRTRVLPAMPSFLDVVGSARDRAEGPPLACVSLGNLREQEHSQRWFSEEQLRLLDKGTADDRRLIAKVMRAQAARVTGGGAHAITRENLEDCAAFLERTAATPPLAMADWGEDPVAKPVAADLQRTLWLLENDLTKTVFVKAYLPWDTHERNTFGQTTYSPPVFDVLSRFFAELSKRKNAHGALADSTRVVVTSEVGRFPRLNGDLGKDHFPEVPMLFFGGRRGGVAFGETGRQMESRTIDLRTGRSGTHPVRLDDVGATLLRAFGLSPEAYGYDGRNLEFLELA